MKTITMTMAAAMIGMMGLLALAEPYDRGNTASSSNEIRNVNADNTGRNVRDREDAAVTPITQGNSESDLSLTRQIRKAIMDSKDLSMNAKNVKVITQNGKVTLRGPVKSEQEKSAIAEMASAIAQKANVENQLEVIQDKQDETRKD